MAGAFRRLKKQAQEAIKEAAQACGQFYVNQRWLGGTLTNLTTIRKSIARMNYIEKLEKQPEYRKMGKQEIAAVKREGEKLQRNLEGIRDMEKHPDAMIIIDTPREASRSPKPPPEDPGGGDRGHERQSGADRLPDRRKR